MRNAAGAFFQSSIAKLYRDCRRGLWCRTRTKIERRTIVCQFFTRGKSSTSLAHRCSNPLWGVALGLICVGDTYAASDDTVRLPAFVRFDSALYLKINEMWKAQ